MIRASKTLRTIFGSPIFGFCVSAASKIPITPRSLLRVLTYHRVDFANSRPDLDSSLISAEPPQLVRHAGWIAREFDPVSLADVLDAVRGKTMLPKRAILLTFDDAYKDFDEQAWPILKSFNLPAALFVPTAYPDNPVGTFWWDELHFALSNASLGTKIPTPAGWVTLQESGSRQSLLKQLKQKLKSLPKSEMEKQLSELIELCGVSKPKPAVLSWNDLKRLDREGVSLVPHTHTHPLLDRLTTEEVRYEIVRSREEIKNRIGKVLPAFAYPSGHFTPEVISVLREESFEIAFTTHRGIAKLDSDDPMMLRRINIARHTPDNLVRFQLIGALKWLTN